MQPAFQFSDRHASALGVFPPIVLPVKGGLPLELLGPVKGKIAFMGVLLALARIELNLHS